METSDVLKNSIVDRLRKMISDSLEFRNVLKDGVAATKANIRVLDLEEEIIEQAPPLIKERLQGASYVLAGSHSEESEDPIDYLIVVGEGQEVGCHSFVESIPDDFYKGMIKHLLYEGLRSHKLIHTVHTRDTYALADGIEIEAYGPGVKVDFTNQGHYRIKIRNPDAIEEIMDEDFKELAKELVGKIVDRVDELKGEGDCSCPICETRRELQKANSPTKH